MVINMKTFKGLYIPPLVEEERKSCLEIHAIGFSLPDMKCKDIWCHECIASHNNSDTFNEWLAPTEQDEHTTLRIAALEAQVALLKYKIEQMEDTDK